MGVKSRGPPLHSIGALTNDTCEDSSSRFLACLTVEVMDPSKIGFSSSLQFSCLETCSTYS